MEPEWEFYSMKERWGDITGVHMFLYTHVMYLRNKVEFWDARVAGRYPTRASLPGVEAFVLQRVDRANLWPPVEPDILVCAEPDKQAAGLHVKQVRAAEYDGSATLGQYVRHEARIGERIRASPHPHLARFRGCAVGPSGEVLGLCWDRYAETLTERIRRRAPIDTESAMAQLRAAVAHLHGLELVHNDVTPDNVMFVNYDSSRLVLVDFDSCSARGSGLPRKRGPTAPGAISSEYENDYVGMESVHKALVLHEQDMRTRA